MKILYSPSEAKSIKSPFKGTLKDNLSFENLYKKRLEVVKKYDHFLKNSPIKDVSKILGLKKEIEINTYKNMDILSGDLELAILRYSGVGFNYLDFSSLDDNAKGVLFDSFLIFSNLFGPLKADDKIPLYKLKQGETIGGFEPSKHYKTHFSSALDEWIGDDLLVDLRAGFYEKFYTPKVPKISMKFLKNGRAVSHYAKAYRGVVARALVSHNPKNEKELNHIEIPNLSIAHIEKKGKNSLYIYDIIP